MKFQSSSPLLLVLVAFTTMVCAIPTTVAVEKRDGPVLALPEAGETTGAYLGRLISPMPLIGGLAGFLGLQAPK
ncbi:hypothetical protein GGI00_005124 [Coemansia sp. RSA 2681]|nr:hypothetical protein GGI00_005124 [Coemansia sp. RSA 2681]KAJ2452241.1 hypothetical protein GGF42_004073 [Coemansia sp. RSA 2424]